MRLQELQILSAGSGTVLEIITYRCSLQLLLDFGVQVQKKCTLDVLAVGRKSATWIDYIKIES